MSFAESSSTVSRDLYNDISHSLTVNLSSASTNLVTVNLSTSGTAIAGTHYVLGSSTLTFNPSELNKTISLTIKKEDCIDESTLILTLHSPSNANLGSVTSHTVTLETCSKLPPL